MTRLMLLIAFALAAACPSARAADVNLAPASEVACASNRADELLTKVTLWPMEHTKPLRVRTITVNGRASGDVKISFGIFADGQLVTGLRVACAFETPLGSPEHRVTYPWNQSIIVPPGDSGSLLLKIEGDPLAGTRQIKIPGSGQAASSTRLSVSGASGLPKLPERTMATLPSCELGNSIIITDSPRGTVTAYCYQTGGAHWRYFSDDVILAKP